MEMAKKKKAESFRLQRNKNKSEEEPRVFRLINLSQNSNYQKPDFVKSENVDLAKPLEDPEVCCCDSVCSCDSVTETVCSCDSVCTCEGVCACDVQCPTDVPCSCDSEGCSSNICTCVPVVYWYPN